jgi:hypothetical protein
MATISIYRFSMYDVREDCFVKSKRWATFKAIHELPGAIIDAASEVEVDQSMVESDIPGMTHIGYYPAQHMGFSKET